MKVILFFCGDLDEDLCQAGFDKLIPMEFIINWDSQSIPVVKDELDWYSLIDRSYLANLKEEQLIELEDMSFNTTVQLRKWTKIDDELACKLYLSV